MFPMDRTRNCRLVLNFFFFRQRHDVVTATPIPQIDYRNKYMHVILDFSFLDGPRFRLAAFYLRRICIGARV